MSISNLNDYVRGVVLSLNPKEGMLKIRVIEQEELASVSDVIKEWGKAAKLLYTKALDQQSAEADKYSEAITISSNVARRINDSLRLKITENSYIGCYDAALSRLLGIMLLSSSITDIKKLYICYLLTSPIHICSNLPVVANRIHGIGTSLINAAEEICVSKNYAEIYLLASAPAKGFYTHLGFHAKNKNFSTMFKERCAIMKEKETRRPSVSSAVPKEELQGAPESGDQERNGISSKSGCLAMAIGALAVAVFFAYAFSNDSR